MKCVCDWPDRCAGSGILRCHGCGGDLCICPCGGQEDCPGCVECEDDPYDDDLEDDL
jgi:hypothetical protein